MGGGLSHDPNAFKKMESNWIWLIASIISAGNFSPLIACRIFHFLPVPTRLPVLAKSRKWQSLFIVK
jgi:hypothetical protein